MPILLTGGLGLGDPWVRYVLNTLLIGYPYTHAILVALTSRNADSVRTRTVGSAVYNLACQASNIIASDIYRTADQPLYRTGNKVLLGIVVWNMAVIIVTKATYIRRNRTREKIWGSMTEDEKAHCLATTKAKGNKRLDFRFAH